MHVTKVSIIVPIYNTQEFLPRCIDSILTQTLKDFELLLIDDGSTDSCGDICKTYAQSDVRIRVIHQHNLGLSGARNTGLDAAMGDYVGFVDSDDYIEPDMYEELYNACLDHKVALACCGRNDVLGQKNTPAFTLDGHANWSSEEAIKRLLLWNKIDSSACDKLFSSDLFDGVRFPLGKINEDIFVVPHLIHRARAIVHVGKALYNYCHRVDSITSSRFTESKMDLLSAIAVVGELVNMSYPHLKGLHHAFYLRGVIYLMGIMQQRSGELKHSASYQLVQKILRNEIMNCLSSPYLGFPSRVKSALLLCEIYPVIWKIIKLLR